MSPPREVATVPAPAARTASIAVFVAGWPLLGAVYLLAEHTSPGLALALYAVAWLGLSAFLGQQHHRVVTDGEAVRITEPLIHRLIGRRDRVIAPGPRQRTELRAHSVSTRRGKIWYWDVWIAGPGREDLVATQASGQLQMRRVAEAIARHLGLGFLDTSGQLRGSKTVELAPDELDLPLAERVRRHPALASRGKLEPAPVELRDERAGATRTISWRLLNGGVALLVAFVALIPVAFYFVPGKRSDSLFAMYGWEGFVTLLKWTAILTGGLLGGLALWSRSVVLTPEHVVVRWHVLGAALPAKALRRADIERVTMGPDRAITLITDAHIVRFTTGWATGHDEWLAQTIERDLIEGP